MAKKKPTAKKVAKSTGAKTASKTSTATETATKTSTEAYTQGNVTVTGGAGAGATYVTITGGDKGALTTPKAKVNPLSAKSLQTMPLDQLKKIPVSKLSRLINKSK